jgi:hypothetical protein
MFPTELAVTWAVPAAVRRSRGSARQQVKKVMKKKNQQNQKPGKLDHLKALSNDELAPVHGGDRVWVAPKPAEDPDSREQ